MSTVADLPTLPALVVGQVHHTRHRPLEHSFTHRHYQWLVDLDAMPTLPRWLRPVAEFRGEDHLAGAPGIAAAEGERAAVAARARASRPATSTRVVMLAQARVLGHTFDPMTAFWCFAADGTLRAVLVEVHNTYGGRHAYVLRPDDVGGRPPTRSSTSRRSTTSRASYAIRFHLTPQRVGVAIRLLVGDEPLVTATVTGAPRSATAAGRGAHGGAAPADDAAGERPDPGARHLALAAPPARPAATRSFPGECEMTADAPRLELTPPPAACPAC